MPAGPEPDAPAVDDEWDALARANSAPEGVAGGHRISLDVALIHCENHLGASWVCAPERWGAEPDGTLDGCVPVRVVWARFASLQMGRAISSMDTARGIGLAFGGQNADKVCQAAIDDAFPG